MCFKFHDFWINRFYSKNYLPSVRRTFSFMIQSACFDFNKIAKNRIFIWNFYTGIFHIFLVCLKNPVIFGLTI